MDESPRAAPDALEIVASSRWYVLAETEDGYGIWPVGRERTEAPLAVFHEDAEGFAVADREFRRRNRQIRAYRSLPSYLAVVVFVTVPIWIVTRISVQAWQYLGSYRQGSQFSQPPEWLALVDPILYALWLGSLVLLLTLFLLRRAGELQSVE